MGLITTFKEKTSGGFYCTECCMSFDKSYAICPYCGRIVTNFEELLTNSFLEVEKGDTIKNAE